MSFRRLTCLFASSLALAALSGLPNDALAGPKAVQHAKKADTAKASRHQRKTAKNKTAQKKEKHPAHAEAKHEPSPSSAPSQSAVVTPSLSGDPAIVKNAVDLLRSGKTSEATALEATIGDPAAKTLVEWLILRHPDSPVGFNRYAAFIANHPGWPSAGLIRRRAEALLWQEHGDAATIHDFTRDQPISAKGHFALARVLLAEGDRDGAARQVRQAWRSDELPEHSEADAYEAFRDLLTSEDHRARMDKRIGVRDFAGAMRAAHHLDDDAIAIVKACIAVSGNETKASDLLNDVSADARKDLGYTLCRADWMMHHDRIADAAHLVLAAAPETMTVQDTDEWWRLRRVLARKLLDLGLFEAAYQVVSDAAPPDNQNYRAEFHFMSGWIALRYLHDAAAARRHFAHIDDGSVNPIVLARANYWRGRAAEALGDDNAMRVYYEAAARRVTAYYGQLARARLGLDRIELRALQPAELDGDPALSEELVRAADVLYALGERDLVVSFVADVAEQDEDATVLTALADLTDQHGDARAMLQIGKTALSRGLALDRYAFPTIGIPQYSPVGPQIDRSVVYSVARTESAFDQHDKSPAKAVGLMQVTPEAGRDTAKRFGVSYDWDRMVSDPVYNTQMGAAELSELLREYKGCHIMTFAGYNAGRGRVQQWVKQYGDPRDPNVDAVDWVERIPFAETRNYVERVMENLQIYRARFEPDAPVISELKQHHAPAQEANSVPLPVTQTSTAE
jgi:soluble lytic murein transglycosylase